MIPLGVLGAATPRAAPAPPLWNPSDLTSPPQLWLNDVGAIVDDGSGHCSQWEDVSGNGYHVTQGTAASRPLIIGAGLNGRRTVRFDGINDVLGTNASGARGIFRNVANGYVFCVAKKVSPDASMVTRTVFSHPRGGSSSGVRFAVYSCVGAANQPGGGGRRLDGDSFAYCAATSARAGSWETGLTLFRWADRAIDLYTNGALENTAAGLWTGAGNTSDTSANGQIGIGASYTSGGSSPETWADSEIAELIVCNSLPSAAEIEKLFGYAAHKWGLTANLPAGHPYKESPP